MYMSIIDCKDKNIQVLNLHNIYKKYNSTRIKVITNILVQ